MNYPDLDSETSGYRAAILTDAGPSTFLPGVHRTFSSARARAIKATDALTCAGETGLKPQIVCFSERPAGFPRYGVMT